MKFRQRGVPKPQQWFHVCFLGERLQLKDASRTRSLAPYGRQARHWLSGGMLDEIEKVLLAYPQLAAKYTARAVYGDEPPHLLTNECYVAVWNAARATAYIYRCFMGIPDVPHVGVMGASPGEYVLKAMNFDTRRGILTLADFQEYFREAHPPYNPHDNGGLVDAHMYDANSNSFGSSSRSSAVAADLLITMKDIQTVQGGGGGGGAGPKQKRLAAKRRRHQKEDFGGAKSRRASQRMPATNANSSGDDAKEMESGGTNSSMEDASEYEENHAYDGSSNSDDYASPPPPSSSQHSNTSSSRHKLSQMLADAALGI